MVVAFVGVNGTGKTTSIARITHWLKENGKSVVLAAADAFRAGAIEQLDLHATKLGCKIIKHQSGGDPAAVAFDAVEHAKAKHRDIVLIDTAGRMQTNSNLMDEMKKIRRVASPDLVIFVGDSLAGNDAVEQAKKFHEAVDIDAVVLTKLDVDAKGGAALSISAIDLQQEYEDIMPFDAFVERIFELRYNKIISQYFCKIGIGISLIHDSQRPALFSWSISFISRTIYHYCISNRHFHTSIITSRFIHGIIRFHGPLILFIILTGYSVVKLI